MSRSSLPGSTRSPVPSTPVTIRRSAPADTRAVERLAALDSAGTPEGELVLAEIGGYLVAAVPLDGGRAVADPFRPTLEIVRLLELRAAQLREGRERAVKGRASRRSALMRPLRALAR
ncbi:MAG: hypothetical protein WD844_12535 [Thermoleophilaceae bacterium]